MKMTTTSKQQQLLAASTTLAVLLLLGTFVFQAAAAQQQQQKPDTLQVRILTDNLTLPWSAELMGSDMVAGSIFAAGNGTTLSIPCDKDQTYRGYSTYELVVTKESDDGLATLTLQVVAPGNGTVLKEASTQVGFGLVQIAGHC
jgi:hypothetical protein